jgi:chromosome segregation ATPase
MTHAGVKQQALNDLAREYDEVNASLFDERRTVDALRADAAHAKETEARLAQHIKELKVDAEAEKKRHRGDLDHEAAKLTALRDELQRVRKAHSAQEDAVGEAQRTQSALSEAKAELAAHRKELEALRAAHRRELQDAAKEAQARCDELRKELAAVRAQLTDAAERAALAAVLKGSNGELLGRSKQHVDRIAELELALNKRRSENETLAAQARRRLHANVNA